MTQKCTQCKEPAAEGRKMCTRHVEYHRDYAARRAAGKIHPVKAAPDVKALTVSTAPKPVAPVVHIDVMPTSLDQAIAKVQAELDALKTAKRVLERLDVA
mgnify:CR=1 FL=1